MPGLRFGERLVVFVGIGLCAVFDWLKCLVTREKADIYTAERAAAAIEGWQRHVPPSVTKEDRDRFLADLHGLTFPDVKDAHESVLKPGEVRRGYGYTKIQLKPGDTVGSRVLGEDGLWHERPRVVPAESLRWTAPKYDEGPVTEAEYAARLKWYEAAGPVGAAVVTGRLLVDRPRRSGKTAAMESELNAYLAADKAETLGEYGDRMRAKFTPEYLKRIAEGLEPGCYDRATGEFFPPPGYDSPEGRRARNIQGGGF